MKPVTVDELQRAWRAVQAGEFRDTPARPGDATARCQRVWLPEAGEGVLLVIGAAAAVGATTLALALATTRGGKARVVECSPAAASGLAAAAATELGADASGWVRGARDSVLLERSSPFWGDAELPTPAPPGEPTFTVVDVGWRPPAGWLAGAVTDARVLVVAARATVPGLRRLETQLAWLWPGQRVVAAVVGPPRKRWPRALQAATGTLTRTLDDEGLVVTIPEDPQLALQGITPAPLPAPLVAAAGVVLDHVEGIRA